MQISSPTLQTLPQLQSGLSGALSTGTGDAAEKAARSLPARSPANEATAAATVQQAGAEPDVTLSATATTAQQDYSAGVYAEIWKNGVKVAQVDNHGGVTSFVGGVAGSTGSGGGQVMASLRAAQIAQAIGGEIRVAGQVLDGATLAMRARLRQVYGN
jgi:hypothetical protein